MKTCLKIKCTKKDVDALKPSLNSNDYCFIWYKSKLDISYAFCRNKESARELIAQLARNNYSHPTVVFHQQLPIVVYELMGNTSLLP